MLLIVTGELTRLGLPTILVGRALLLFFRNVLDDVDNDDVSKYGLLLFVLLLRLPKLLLANSYDEWRPTEYPFELSDECDDEFVL